MSELVQVPLSERARRCHHLADEAGRCAKRSSGTIKASYETSAAQWRKLAGDIDAIARLRMVA